MMKTQLLILMMLIASFSYAQMTPKQAKAYAKEMQDSFQEMMETATVKQPFVATCDPEAFYDGLNKSNLVPEPILLAALLERISQIIELPAMNDNYDLGLFQTHSDKAANAAENTKTYVEFVKMFTGKDLGDVDKKDAENLNTYFKRYKQFSLNGFGVKNSATNLSGCAVNSYHTISISKRDYPQITWEFKSEIMVDCKCSIPPVDTDIKEVDYEVTGTSSGLFSFTDVSFGTIRNGEYEIKELECCPDGEVGMVEPLEDGNYNVSLPDHYLGVSGGISLTNDFDETTYCIGAQYLYNATEIGDSNLLVGANVGYGGSSFMDWKSRKITAGGTVQLFTPLTQSGQTQATNGISADYINGCNDNMGVVDDFTGYSITANTGVNVQLSDSFALFMEIPLIMHQSLTFKPENGGTEFETSETEVMVFKNSPIKVGARIGF